MNVYEQCVQNTEQARLEYEKSLKARRAPAIAELEAELLKASKSKSGNSRYIKYYSGADDSIPHALYPYLASYFKKLGFDVRYDTDRWISFEW